MKNKFLKNLNSFQNKAVDILLLNKSNKIFVKSQKFTGKTMLAKKIFESVNDEIIIYHTGCCPELFKKAKKEFISLISKYKNKKMIIILDEFYDNEMIEYFLNFKFLTLYIFTNDLALNNKDYMNFNYYNFYKEFINNECGKYLNIHEVLNKDINFSKKNESLRYYSKSTAFYIKENGLIKEYRMGG